MDLGAEFDLLLIDQVIELFNKSHSGFLLLQFTWILILHLNQENNVLDKN